MNSPFNITITAVNKTAKAIAGVKASIAGIVKPVGDTRRAVGALGREMGLQKLGKGFVGVYRAAGDATRAVAGMIPAIAGVTSIASIAGVAKLAEDWSKAGFEIERTAATLGVSTTALQLNRGAARLAGVSAEALTGGMKALGDTIEDALYGRNQQALVVLNRMGIRIHRLKDGTIDTGRAFDDLANAIGRVKSPQVQGLIARTFGLEEALPLLRKGAAGVEALRRKVAESGAVMTGPAVFAAARFRESVLYLDLATQGLRNTIGERLIPVVQPLIEQLTAWIVKNRELIGQKVASVVSAVAKAIGSIDWTATAKGVKSVVEDVTAVVNAMGGLKGVLTAIAAVKLAPLVGAITTIGTTLATTPAGWALIGVGAAMIGGHYARQALSGPANPESPAGQGFSAPGRGGRPVTPREMALRALQGSTAIPAGTGPANAVRVPSAIAGAPASEVNVRVHFDNVPAGVRTSIDSSGPARVDARIGRALPAGIAP